MVDKTEMGDTLISREVTEMVQFVREKYLGLLGRAVVLMVVRVRSRGVGDNDNIGTRFAVYVVVESGSDGNGSSTVTTNATINTTSSNTTSSASSSNATTTTNTTKDWTIYKITIQSKPLLTTPSTFSFTL